MDLIECIKSSGIVGAGGAGFPSHVKLSANAEYIILNAAECEPLLKVDQQILLVYADQIIKGLVEIVKKTQAKKAYIGIKGKHKEVIEVLNSKLNNNDFVEVCILGDFYPAGDEQALVYEVTKRVVPEAGIPLKVSCIVTNVETVLNVENAIEGKVVTETYLTVTGKVPNPITLKLPIGTSVREALEISGLKNFNGIKVIDGGPMMGKIIENIDEPITKTTKGLIVLDEDHFLIRKKSMTVKMALHQSKAACLQCRMCTELCPRYLLGHKMQPHLMMRKSNYDRGNDISGAETALLCCECGACEIYACPAGLSPKLINRNYKEKLAEKGVKYTPNKQEFIASATRDYKKIPVKRLITKLGLKEYDVKAPLIEIDYIPQCVKIPLKQHIGAPCKATVEIGQVVNKGDVVGEIPENALGARVHASINGKVTEISSYIVIESL